ncbi:hypothetical protein DBB29_00790 [Pandoraea cepalis]|uniref:Uncharacterized protein n=1 Tax=Pandoraea cepalis TaxID=2508294 RepID=A0AAW7MGY9_9BURK|nr:hypothetical protein [Pandoraea cepalis]MDN4576670.1 hypothetical protein [Pandoraea cepalis]
MKEEVFIASGLTLIDRESARWIANQALFNGKNDRSLEPSVKAGLVTAVNGYVQKGMLPEEEVKAALDAETIGDARVLIDRLDLIVRAASKSA